MNGGTIQVCILELLGISWRVADGRMRSSIPVDLLE